MEMRAFAATGARVAVIGQGTWDIPEHGARMAEAKAALQRGIELGMTHLDTAEMYGNGRAEEILGEAISGLDRASLFLTSKVLPGNASYDGTIAACERTLRRLKTEYLDLYLLHWPGNFPIEDTMAGLERLVTDGKARAIGVSNFDVDALQQAQAALRSAPLACNQVLYHLGERAIEVRLLPYCQSEGIALVAYTPFGRGAFLRGAGGEVIASIAAKHGKTPRQVVLRFLTRNAAVFTIPKASTVPHVEENAGGSGWSLDDADVEEIDRAFPVRDRGSLATL